MGRYYFDKKDTVEDCLDVDVYWLKKHGYFCGYKYGGIKWSFRSGHESNISLAVKTHDHEQYINFIYTLTDKDGQKEHFDYKVPIVTTKCNFGGVRYWFLCSLSGDGMSCGRRVGKLYMPSGGKYFGCRHCYQLSYDARNEGKGRFFAFRLVLDSRTKLDKLQTAIKRRFYNGKPTRKYKKYMRCVQTYNRMAPILMQSMDSLLSK